MIRAFPTPQGALRDPGKSKNGWRPPVPCSTCAFFCLASFGAAAASGEVRGYRREHIVPPFGGASHWRQMVVHWEGRGGGGFSVLDGGREVVFEKGSSRWGARGSLLGDATRALADLRMRVIRARGALGGCAVVLFC